MIVYVSIFFLNNKKILQSGGDRIRIGFATPSLPLTAPHLLAKDQFRTMPTQRLDYCAFLSADT